MQVYEEARAQLTASLIAAGFDFAAPRPMLAWDVFKRFILEYVGVLAEEVGFECWSDFTREDVFYLDFVCRLEGSENILSVELRCSFTRPLTAELLPVQVSFWSQGFDDLQGYLNEVERLPAFLKYMQLGGWRCEIE